MKNHTPLAICGGCVSKIPAGFLSQITKNIPVKQDKNLLVGFETSDDGAVYKIDDQTALIQTVDFFPPMVDDPYLFGKIAATNAISDVFAMGGRLVTALNLLCFPEGEDIEAIQAILAGGAEVVAAAGGVLCGGHSINDKTLKYGLSVTGIVHPNQVLYNNTAQIGNKIVLTKSLGVSMVTAAYRVGEATQASYDKALSNMQQLNSYVVDMAKKYAITAATDVTGFGLLGHLNEMSAKSHSIVLDSACVSYIEEAKRLAEEFLTTSGGQNNREFLADKADFSASVPEYMREILFDPQTSGGMLMAVPAERADDLVMELQALGVKAATVAEVVPRRDLGVYVV